MNVTAAEILNLKKIESTHEGTIIEVSASKKIVKLFLFQKDSSGRFLKFYEDYNIGKKSKQYFITKYRLSTDETSKIRAIATLEDGTKISSEIDIEEIPNKPEPTTSVTPTESSTPSVNPPKPSNPTPSSSQSPTPSQSQSPAPSETPTATERITLNKTSAKLALNDDKTVQLKATLKNAKSGTKIIWSTTNNNVATVNKSGLVTAVGTGQARISVKTASGKEAFCDVNVTASKEKIEILFVGNSKTFKSNIPDKFKKLAKNGGYSVNISTATKGGKTLEYLTTKSNKSEDELTGNNNYNTIIGKAYDYVVMQEQSTTYASDYDKFLSGAKNLKKLVKKKNNNVKLFVRQCWVHKSSVASERNKGYSNAKNVANKIGASLIYDGKAMYKAKSKTNIKLFIDNIHQSKAGAYLAAASIYSAMFDRSPVDLNYVAGLNSADAKTLRQIAWNVYSSNK